MTKNHSFLDGNKRIAATLFLYFLNQNQVLFFDGEKLIEDHTLAALTILIAESRSEEKETMIIVLDIDNETILCTLTVGHAPLSQDTK